MAEVMIASEESGQGGEVTAAVSRVAPRSGCRQPGRGVRVAQAQTALLDSRSEEWHRNGGCRVMPPPTPSPLHEQGISAPAAGSQADAMR